MDTIFINSENSKRSDSHRHLLNLSDKINLKRSNKYVALSNLNSYYTWKNVKSHTKIINLKYQLLHGMKSLNYLVDHIQYQMFNPILSVSSKDMRQLLIMLQ